MSSTPTWVTTYDHGTFAFLLVFDGVDLAFTTSDDVSGVETALDTDSSSMWTVCYGGLEYPGEIGQSISPFAAKIEVPALSLTVTDSDDVLLGYLFGEASAANKTRLTTAVDCDDATLAVESTTGFAASGSVWVGLEEVTYSGKTASSFTGCNRGQRSAGYAAGGGTYEFGRPHRVTDNASQGGNYSPVVSDRPATWYNRGVSLYLIHRDDQGVWTGPENAALLYYGRIKAWSESGDGRITLDTVSFTEALQTTLLADQYRADVKSGVYVTSDQLSFRVEATRATTATPPVVNYYRSGWLTLDLAAPGFFTHDEIAASINNALNDVFIVGASFPGTATCTLVRPGSDSASGLYEFVYVDTAGAAADRWIVEVFLNPDVAKVLGFEAATSFRNDVGTWATTLTLRRTDDETWTAQATSPPLRIQVRVDGYTYRGIKIYVENADTQKPFLVQPTIPSRWNDRGKAAASAGTEGFLRIRDVIFPVQDNGDDTFTITGWAFYDYGGAGTELATRDDVVNALRVTDDGTAEPVEVVQVWIEEGRIGDLFAKLILSTGTSGYNTARDVYPRGMSAGVPWSLVDEDSVVGMGDAPYTLLVEKPTPLAVLLESALNLTGRHLVWSGGKLTVVSPGEETSLVSDLVALTEDNKAAVVHNVGAQVVEATQTGRSLDGVINRATLRYQRVGEKWLREITVNNVASQGDHEQKKAIVVDGYGVYEGPGGISGAHVNAWQSHVAATSLALFSRPLAYVDRTYDMSLATRCVPGARFVLTDERVVNPSTGTRGVSGIQGWVISSSFDWRTGVGRMRGVFSAHHGAKAVCAPAPSARVDDTASTGGYTRGYDSATKRLKLKQHEYSRTTENKDLTYFSVGDKVRVVELDATAPNAWADTIAGVDAANNYVTLTTGLGTWGATGAVSGYYVLKFDDVATVNASQYAYHAFQADFEKGESRVGVADSGPVFAASDAAVSSDAPTYATRFRKISATEDVGQGLPASTHLIADVARWTNCAASYHRAPVFATFGNWRMTWRPSADTDWHVLAGPFWVPHLYGDFGLDIWAIVELETTAGAAATADATLRVVASSAVIRGTDSTFQSVTYPDGPSEGHYVDITVDNASADPQVVTGSLASLPLTSIPFIGISGCWVTVEGKLGHVGDRMRILTGVIRRKAI